MMEQTSPIRRFSFRRQKLAQSFLAERLRAASLGILSATPWLLVWSRGGFA